MKGHQECHNDNCWCMEGVGKHVYNDCGVSSWPQYEYVHDFCGCHWSKCVPYELCEHNKASDVGWPWTGWRRWCTWGPVKWRSFRVWVTIRRNEWRKTEQTDLEDNSEFSLNAPWILRRAISCYSKIYKKSTKAKQLLLEWFLKPYISHQYLPQPILFFFFSLSTSPPPPFPPAPVHLSCAGVNVSFLPHTNCIAFCIPIWYFWNVR